MAAMQLLFQGEMQVTRLSERCLLVFSMGTFYSIFIFILTELVALIGELNSKGSKYRRMLRDLNGMMRDNAFPRICGFASVSICASGICSLST